MVCTIFQGPVQLRFEKVQSGSLPPKFGEVKYDAGPEDKFVSTRTILNFQQMIIVKLFSIPCELSAGVN